MKIQKLKKLKREKDCFSIDSYMMNKALILIVSLFIFATSCKEKVNTKPKNLISKDKMVNIIYDIAILEATRAQNYSVQNYPTSIEYIKNKYHIDSLTYAQSTQYYASDIKEYKKMYDVVKERLTKENAKITNNKASNNPDIILENGIEQ